jgi:hypothetical protein
MPPCVSSWLCSNATFRDQHCAIEIIILDRPVHDLAGLEIRVDDRAAGNRNVLASQTVQTTLVEAIPIETNWPSTNRRRDPKTHPHHGKGQSNLGSTATKTRLGRANPERHVFAIFALLSFAVDEFWRITVTTMATALSCPNCSDVPLSAILWKKLKT